MLRKRNSRKSAACGQHMAGETTPEVEKVRVPCYKSMGDLPRPWLPHASQLRRQSLLRRACAVHCRQPAPWCLAGTSLFSTLPVPAPGIIHLPSCLE